MSILLSNHNISLKVVEARKDYIQRVSSFRVHELGSSFHRLQSNSPLDGKEMAGEPLFESLVIVGLNRDPYTGFYHPYIRETFPPNVSAPPLSVPSFCLLTN